jgi:hypothetical protein
MKMTIANIRESDILTAILKDDLDDACAYLQGIAGITDGGIASVCFSDVDFDWATATKDEREEKTRAWLETEKVYES